MSAVVDAIYELHASKEREQRLYLGGSALGAPCERQLWYGFRGAALVEPAPRMLRLWETGHREEDRMVAELKAVGCEVLEKDPRTGEQWSIDAYGGHFAGHFDGLIRRVPGEDPDEWFLLELKTSNEKRFKALDRDGAGKTKPQHWAQMQIYIGFARAYWDYWGLDGDPPRQALYLAHCKNDDKLYEEVVIYDDVSFQMLGAKALEVLSAVEPPPPVPKASPRKPPCLWCDFSHLCLDGDVPAVDCRTCMHSTPDLDAGGWVCERYGRAIPDEGLTIACGEHLYIAPLLEKRHGGVRAYDIDPIDAPVRWIEFEDGTVHIAHSLKGELDGMTSAELRQHAKENPPWPKM